MSTTEPTGSYTYMFRDLSTAAPQHAVRLPVDDRRTDLQTWSRAVARDTCDPAVPLTGVELRAELLRIHTAAAWEMAADYRVMFFPAQDVADVNYVLGFDFDGYRGEPRPTLEDLVDEWVAGTSEGRIDPPKVTGLEIPLGPAASIQYRTVDPEDGVASEYVTVVALPLAADDVVVTFSALTSDLDLGAEMASATTRLAEYFTIRPAADPQAVG